MKHILTEDHILLNCEFISHYAISVQSDKSTIWAYSDPARTDATSVYSTENAKAVEEAYKMLVNFMATRSPVLSFSEKDYLEKYVDELQIPISETTEAGD